MASEIGALPSDTILDFNSLSEDSVLRKMILQKAIQQVE